MKRTVSYVIFLIGLLSYINLTAIQNHDLSHLALKANTTSPTTTEIIFECPDYSFEDISQAGQHFSSIKIEGAEKSLKAGYPELPFFTTSIAIPFNSHPVLKSENVLINETIQNVLINPSQGLEPDEKTFLMDEKAYNSSVKYPENSIYISEPQVFRDFYVISINYYPFSYDSKEKKLVVNKKAVITIEHDNNSSSEFCSNGTISRAFDPIYRASIANYDQIRTDYPIFTDPTILMIYPNSTNTEFANSLNLLINWKKQTGFKVNAVSTSVTGSSNTSIKNYIQNQYNNTSTRPDFIMLIGDAAGGELVVPTYNLQYASGMPSGDGDDPYTFLAGDDYYADVMIGRLSAESASTFTVLVSKIINYERYPLSAGTAYLQKALLVGATSSSGISTIQVNQYIKNCMEYFDPSHQYDEYYGSPTASQMVASLSNGAFYFSFRGYIGMSGFGDTQVASLTNVSKLAVCVFLTCGTGNIASSSMIETITRAGSSSQPKGAIGAYGLATSHTLTPYNNFISCGIANAFFLNDITSMGGALLYSQNKLLDTYNGDILNHSKTLNQWCNLIGDPTINIHRSIPKVFTVNVSTETIYIGTRNIQVQVLDPDNHPVEGVAVTGSCNSNSIINTQYTDNNGYVILPISEAITTSLTLTARKADFVINVKTIPRSSTIGKLEFNTYTLSDTPNGNNNQLINPGETIKITPALKNNSSATISGINIKMRSSNPFISITDSTAYLFSIASGNIINLSNEFSFNVNNNYPANQPLALSFEISHGTERYNTYLDLEVKAIDLDLVSSTVLNLSGLLNPGETAPLKVKIRNNGEISTGTLSAILRSKSDFLVITDSLKTFSNINTGQEYENSSLPFTIRAFSEVFPGVTVLADLILTNAQGYREVLEIEIPIGTVTATDPMAPDAFGYIAYDITDVEYDDAPVYNWIDITSTGSVVPLTDIGDDQDDVELVTLPFSFRMYGKNYNQASICSNGWLSFGVTNESTGRNVAIPGPMVPRPIIAPYWTDLAKSGTGSNVYTYYDANEHYYIITWNNMKVCKWTYGGSAITTANVSFQVVLYDPIYHATDLGDSPILIQYKDFHPGYNNDDLERPNNYFTTGIQDETGNIGLQYVFNNHYSAGASPLGNNTAILFTQPTTPIVIPTHYNKVWAGNGIQHMNFTISSVSVNGSNLEVDDEIAVFDGDYCVGLVKVTSPVSNSFSIRASLDRSTTSAIDGYTVGHSVSFKIWKNSTQTEYNNSDISVRYSSGSSSFAIGGVSVLSMAISNSLTQNVTLTNGWNLISFNTAPENLNLINIFNSLIANESLITVVDQQGRQIRKIGPAWNNGIGNLNSTQGYRVRVNTNTSFSLHGTRISLPMSISLSSGWNIISYPYTTEQNALSLITSLTSSNQLVTVVDESGRQIRKIGASWNNGIGNFKPGKAYAVRVNQPCILTFSNISTTLRNQESSTQTRKKTTIK